MVEAMFEQSPEYFKKYQKTYRFFLSETLPTEILKTNTAMAYSLHEGNDSSHLFCHLSKERHYHVLADLESEIIRQLPVKCYVVPCLYTCYRWLVHNKVDEFRQGEVPNRLYNAVQYNVGTFQDRDENLIGIRKKLPFLCATAKVHVQTQTDQLPRATLERFVKLINGRHSLEMYNIMDILESGAGGIDVDMGKCKRLRMDFDTHENND